MKPISPPVSFATYLDRVLARYRRRIPAIGAVGISVIFAIWLSASHISGNTQLLKAISAHVSTLLEGTNSSDLRRLIKSIAEEKNAKVLVIDHGLITESSGSNSDLRLNYQKPSSIKLNSETFLSTGGLLTIVPVSRPDGPSQGSAEIVMITPLYSLLVVPFCVGLFLLQIGLFLVESFSEKLRKVVNDALKPVADLNQAIRSLRDLQDPTALKPSGIEELENIRSAIIETHEDLITTRDELAEKKAKALATDAYRNLIHDLHNPACALGNLLTIVNDESRNSETRAWASKKIPGMATQLSSMVEAAKENLDFEATLLKNEDIRVCIQDAAEQASLASPKYGTVNVEHLIPGSEILATHDARLMRRAVGNLVKNAIDACRAQVQVIVERIDKGISIRVLDDGPGLSQEQAGLALQGRIKSTKDDRQGYGLASANHIARAHGGRIIYRRSELGGACFEIRI